VELAEQQDAFARRGIGMVSIVPEPPEALRAFAQRQHIGYPLLSDPGAAIIRRLGVQDTTFGDVSVPYAGSLMLDGAGVITDKFFEPDTEYRRTAASILALGGAGGAGGPAVEARRFTARAWISNPSIAPGQRFTLGVEIELQPRHHAYAPGARGYRGLELRLDPDPLFEFGPARLPPARPLFFAPLNETVPVFEGRVELLRDATQRYRAVLPSLSKADEVGHAITGTLQYQVCSDALCDPPGALPLRFELRIRRWTK
jgi:AhpC/TSA family protein/cytochrome c biogenesis DsbD-like protein